MPVSKSPRADQRFRIRVNQLARRQTLRRSLAAMLQELNPYLRGWSAYYRYCVGAKRIFASLDWHVRQRLWLWLRAKHKRVPGDRIALVGPSGRWSGQLVWAEGGRSSSRLRGSITGGDLKWPTTPRLLESRMHNERCKSGSESRRGKLAVEHSAHV
jgi:hypothetical protein